MRLQLSKDSYLFTDPSTISDYDVIRYVQRCEGGCMIARELEQQVKKLDTNLSE